MRLVWLILMSTWICSLGENFLKKLKFLNWMKICWILCLIVGASKSMCRFYYESIHFKKEGNIFELMDIVEYINEVLLVPSYIQSTRTYATRSGHSRKKRGEDTLSHTYYLMSESDGNCRKKIYRPSKGWVKTSLLHGPGNSSDECKVLGDFGSRYAKSRPTKYRGTNPIQINKFNRQQENNSIVDSAVDEILPYQNKR